MKNYQFIKNSLKEFKKHWISFIFLIILSNFFIGNIVVPLLKLIANALMTFGDISYISYDNILQIIISHPIISIFLFLLIILLVTIVFVQFTFLLLSIAAIQNDKGNLKLILKESIFVLKSIKPKEFIFFLIYFILIWPFSGAIFHTPLLDKVVIPKFILEFIEANLVLSIVLATIYIVISMIGIRLVYTLPNMILKKESLKNSIDRSLEITKGKYFHYIVKFLIALIITVIISFISSILLYLLQYFIDTLPNPFPIIGGIVNLTLLQFINQVSSTLGIVFLFNIFLQSEYFHDITWKYMKDNSEITKKNRRFITKVIIAIFNSFFILSILISNIYFLNESINELPITISHRGVNNKNGVQNTVPALYKTIKYKPDYVEIDLLETKDEKFVVMHDENLYSLAGINKAPHELTLKELTDITIRENGYEAKITSFDEYLGHANKNNQKLLIEFKTTKYDSKNMLDNFLKQYKNNIIKNEHIFQTLDYELMKEIKEKVPEFYISYILPVNFIFPRTDANGYTMEETTLDSSFVGDASRVGKNVFVWTVNDENSMTKSIYLDVDGIITDNLEGLNKVLKDFERKPTFADRIITYLILLPSS